MNTPDSNSARTSPEKREERFNWPAAGLGLLLLVFAAILLCGIGYGVEILKYGFGQASELSVLRLLAAGFLGLFGLTILFIFVMVVLGIAEVLGKAVFRNFRTTMAKAKNPGSLSECPFGGSE